MSRFEKAVELDPALKRFSLGYTRCFQKVLWAVARCFFLWVIPGDLASGTMPGVFFSGLVPGASCFFLWVYQVPSVFISGFTRCVVCFLSLGLPGETETDFNTI